MAFHLPPPPNLTIDPCYVLNEALAKARTRVLGYAAKLRKRDDLTFDLSL